MKRFLSAFAAMLLACVFVLTAACTENKEEPEGYGTLAIADIRVTVGESEEIEPVFSDGGTYEIVYTFDGSDIRIEGGRVYALTAGKEVEVTAKTQHHTATFTVTTLAAEEEPEAELFTIGDVAAWVGYPPTDFVPVFAEGTQEGEISYEYDEAYIELDAEACTVTALQAGGTRVKASMDGYETQFTVMCYPQVDMSGTEYDTSEYDAYESELSARWAREAESGKTTAFIGDSFFDTRWFWTNFGTFYADKDALCMGISSTTTFDWEKFMTDRGFFGDIAPKNIAMHIGTNNIYDDNMGVSETVRDVQRMFTLMHSLYPQTNIYYFGISVRASDQAKIARTRQVNEQMQAWCSERAWIVYIDTPSRLTTDMLRDGVHPKAEYYSVFVDALAETDIVMESKEIGDRIPDIVRNVSQGVGDSPASIIYGGAVLTRDFILSGKLDIAGVGDNPHVEFRFLGSSDRFLIWGNEIKAGGSGDLKLGYACNNNYVSAAPPEDTYRYTAGRTLTLEWKIAVIDDDAYLFVGDELKLVYTDLPDDAAFMLSSEHVDCTFYEMEAVTSASDGAGYAAALEGMREAIDEYGGRTGAGVIRP